MSQIRPLNKCKGTLNLNLLHLENNPITKIEELQIWYWIVLQPDLNKILYDTRAQA